MSGKVRVVAIAALLACAASSPAAAQGYIVPFAGYDFGGNAGSCPSLLNDCSEKKTAYGVAVGGLSAGVLGVEAEFGYAPDFFGDSREFGDNSIATVMGNLLVALPLGPIRPYAAGGLGLMRTRVSLDLPGSSLSASQNALGVNIGGGVMILFPGHLGVRGDYRHFKSTADFSLLGIDIENAKLSYNRVSVGLVLHW